MGLLSSCFELGGVNTAVVEVDEIGEHGVAEMGKRLRFALADEFLRNAECSLKEGLGVQFVAGRGLVEVMGWSM